jgi:hypothetical protein
MSADKKPTTFADIAEQTRKYHEKAFLDFISDHRNQWELFQRMLDTPKPSRD